LKNNETSISNEKNENSKYSRQDDTLSIKPISETSEISKKNKSKRKTLNVMM